MFYARIRKLTQNKIWQPPERGLFFLFSTHRSDTHTHTHKGNTITITIFVDDQLSEDRVNRQSCHHTRLCGRRYRNSCFVYTTSWQLHANLRETYSRLVCLAEITSALLFPRFSLSDVPMLKQFISIDVRLGASLLCTLCLHIYIFFVQKDRKKGGEKNILFFLVGYYRKMLLSTESAIVRGRYTLFTLLSFSPLGRVERLQSCASSSLATHFPSVRQWIDGPMAPHNV